MLEHIKNGLSLFGITDAKTIPLSACKITAPHKLEKSGFKLEEKLFAIVFAIPYYSEHKNKNISSYSIPRDYHLFCKELFDAILPNLRSNFNGYRFAGFSDNSPIDERDAAARAGLGILGANKMLITEKYSSYVFLAEIITDFPFDKQDEYRIRTCEMCGKCFDACPKNDIGECLSYLTQKKGELTDDEKLAILKYGTAWGCDICQEVCPHTQKAICDGTIYTNIDFFTSELIPSLSSKLVEDMTDVDFSARAYSWRRRETIMRNLELLENNRKKDNTR